MQQLFKARDFMDFQRVTGKSMMGWWKDHFPEEIKQAVREGASPKELEGMTFDLDITDTAMVEPLCVLAWIVMRKANPSMVVEDSYELSFEELATAYATFRDSLSASE